MGTPAYGSRLSYLLLARIRKRYAVPNVGGFVFSRQRLSTSRAPQYRRKERGVHKSGYHIYTPPGVLAKEGKRTAMDTRCTTMMAGTNAQYSRTSSRFHVNLRMIDNAAIASVKANPKTTRKAEMLTPTAAARIRPSARKTRRRQLGPSDIKWLLHLPSQSRSTIWIILHLRPNGLHLRRLKPRSKSRPTSQ